MPQDTPENAPLLGNGHREETPLGPGPLCLDAASWQAKSPASIVLLVTLVKFCAVTSGMLMLVPMYRLMEDALCHVHFRDDSHDLMDEARCKVDAVQSRLAFLIGWIGLVNSITTLVAAVPYGTLADRIGRRPTVALSFAGLAGSFCCGPFLLGILPDELRRQPKLLLLGSLFQLLGGGVPVLYATLYAMASDVSDANSRASSFLYLTFGATAGGLAGPLLAGLLMQHFGPWVPIYTAICVTPIIACFLLFIPETLPAGAKTRGLGGSPHALARLRARALDGSRELARSFEMLRDPGILLILVTFLIQHARLAGSTAILPQYLSKHFGWTLAQTSLLLSPLGMLNLLILVLLPRLSQALISRFSFRTFRKDLFLTRISTVILIVAALIQGFSHHIALFLIGLFVGVFGAADSPLARATITHYVDSGHTSRLYALIGVVEVVGSFMGGPVLAWLFDQGLRRKGIWRGLPWFYIGLLCLLAGFALLFVRPPRKDEREDAAAFIRAEDFAAADNEIQVPE